MAASTHINRKDFEDVFPSLVEEVSQAAKQYNIPEAALQWFQKVPSLKSILVAISNNCFSHLTQTLLEESLIEASPFLTPPFICSRET